MSIKVFIVHLRWPIYLAAIFFAGRWVLESRSNESWAAFIGALAVLVADIAVQLATEEDSSAAFSRYINRLRTELN